MMRGPFRFDVERHRYTVGGVEVPAVGTIVRWARVNAHDGPWMREEHRERGKAIHAASLALDIGAEDADTLLRRLPDAWRPYLQAYVNFRGTGKVFKWRRMEQPYVNRSLGFAGTPDRVGSMNGYAAILEIKTGHETDWHGLQTAGQDILLHRDWHLRRYRRFVVYLHREGTFKLREHVDSGDYLRFLDALHRFHDALRRERASLGDSA